MYKMAKTIDADREYFENIPWCSKLLEDSKFIVTPTFSRQHKESTEDALFAETLNTKDTIRACLSLYMRPASEPSQINELRMLVSLGYGVNSYPSLCHGGIVGVIIDEAMGMLLTLNKNLKASPVRSSTVTAYLNVTYLRPVATPQTLLVIARLREIKGRKMYLDASIADGCKESLAKAEALWIEVNEVKEKL